MSNAAFSELRASLRELRVHYHQALARKLGHEIPSSGELHRIVSSEPDEGQVIARLEESRGASASWSGLSRLRRLISQFGRWG